MDALAAARRWAEAWKTGWEALDADRVLGLYAADAVHFTEPFRAPARGAHEVRAYVERVFGEEEDPRVWVAGPIVDGERAAIAWWASVVEDGADITLAGVSVSASTRWASSSNSGTRGTRPGSDASRPSTARSDITTPELSHPTTLIGR